MKIRKLVQVTLFGLLLSLGSSAVAATFKAKIKSILFYDDHDLVYIYVEGGTVGKPACAGSNGDYISFSMARPRAREYLAGLMFAFGSGKPVVFTTAGACIDQTVSDTLRYFAVE